MNSFERKAEQLELEARMMLAGSDSLGEDRRAFEMMEEAKRQREFAKVLNRALNQ